MGRQAVKEFVKGMLVKERAALDGMKRALRKLKKPTENPLDVEQGGIVADRPVDAMDETLMVNGVVLDTGLGVNGNSMDNGEASGAGV